MSLKALDNLVKIGTLKREESAPAEIKGLILTAKKRLTDAQISSLSPESRFDLSYNAAHALALAALRSKGYRSENRFSVFQSLSSTTNLTASQIRILSDAHNKRNRTEYEGAVDVSEAAIKGVVQVATLLLEFLEASTTAT